MSLQKLSAGDGYTYLTRQVAAADDTHRGRGSLGEYYEQTGESPGVWLGSGLGSLAGERPETVVAGVVTEEQMCALFGLGRHPNDRAIIRQLARDGASRSVQDAATKLGHAYHFYEPSAFHAALAARYREFNTDRGARGDAAIPDAVRARIRSELGRKWFRTEHHRDPLDGREFTGYLALISRPAPMPVAGYDLTFSPVKSVSALWAIAPHELAATIAACHDEAVRGTIGWLEKHAAYTRRGTDGVAQVDTTGLIAAAFTHRDSRAGDPDLHTHVAVSNKVCIPDGRWLSLDGRALYRNKVAASEHYNTCLEALLIERVGVRFSERGDAGDGRREVREIAGLPPELLRAWSSRRADIETELAALARRFQEEHGRPPTTIERAELAQQATLSTRDRKHEPRSEAEQRRTWQAEAAELLRGADQVESLVRRVTGHTTAPAAVDVDKLAATVIETVQSSRATWQEHHVRAEAERACRCLAAVPDFLVDQVTERALSPACSVLLTAPPSIDEPNQLRRRDGSSVYEVAGSRRYTSTAVLNAEHVAPSVHADVDGSAALAPLLVDVPAQQPRPVIDRSPLRKLVRSRVRHRFGLSEREVRHLNLDAVRERQPGVGQNQVAKLTAFAVHLDEPLAPFTVVRVAAVVVAGDERHVGRNPGEVRQGRVEVAERNIAEMPQLVVRAEHRSGTVHQIDVHVVHVGVRAVAEPDDVRVPVMGVRREVPHPSTIPFASNPLREPRESIRDEATGHSDANTVTGVDL